jgi:voltage-gated potassium channel
VILHEVYVRLRRSLRNPPPPLRVAALIMAVLLYGTTGFLYFELPGKPYLGWTDGIWYAVATITTIGYGDLSPTTNAGRFLVAVPVMFFGIGLLGYVLSVAASALVQARTQELHGMSQFSFTDHLVILNYPSGSKVVRILDELAVDAGFGSSKEVVVVDEDLAELPPALASRIVHFVRGNPSRDETLGRANIDTASHAIVLSKRTGDPASDAMTVMIVLAIEARAENIVTVAECVDTGSEELLRKAGCNRVVCAGRLDAHLVSHELLNPGAQEVLEQLTSNQKGRQQLYLLSLEDSGADWQKVAERCRRDGHLAIGIRRQGGSHLNPAPDFRLVPGDQIITVGPVRLDSVAAGNFSLVPQRPRTT